MKTIWFEGLKGEEKENFRLKVLDSQIVLDKLNKIVYNMLRDREKAVPTDYDSPSWSHKQAHRNGEAAALRQLLEILDLGHHA